MKYCTCRTEKSSGFMIQCENCEEWFHGKCVKIKKPDADNIDKYYCNECRKNDPALQIVMKLPKSKTEKTKPITSIKNELQEERKQDKKVIEQIQNVAFVKQRSKINKISPAKSIMSRKRVSQKTKTKGYIRKQCANPDCIYEARSESKYCSDECGYAFNKLRYETFFIPKWKQLEQNHSQARMKRMRDLDQLEGEKVDVEQLIKSLKLEKEELESNIKLIKEQAKRMSEEHSSLQKEDEDDSSNKNEDVEEITTGDIAKTFCFTCGHTFPPHISFKHWSMCHKRHEDLYNFSADVIVNFTCKEDENPKLYCHHQDKKTKRYCMQLESACPQHSNWQNDKDEVCGCPLNIMQKLVPDGNYCLELKKDCTLHYHWDKFRLAQMNMQRVQAFTKLDIINERIRVTSLNLADTYGGVVGVMLHSTSDHRPDKNGLDMEITD